MGFEGDKNRDSNLKKELHTHIYLDHSIEEF